ncbi:MAG: metal ABC transporter ATP-binding protein [Selenomonadaceae bacterium]|nr:metal ABC transporter ATP-binding protein [Selenomonadaceae bacterium]
MFHHKPPHIDGDGCCQRFCCTKIEDFSVAYADMDVISNINAHIHCGQLTAVIGPNGAGKSTLIRAILGEIPHTGKISYVSGDGRKAARPRIGYVPQYLRFDVSAPTTVEDFFMAALTNRPVWLMGAGKLRGRILNDLSRVRAEGLVDRRLGALSGGELQRVLLALALDPLPELLILDEPVSGVDHNGLTLFYEILDNLRETEDMAILLVSHDLELVASNADKVLFLRDGKATSGTPRQVFSDERVKEIFGEIHVPDDNYDPPVYVPVKHGGDE